MSRSLVAASWFTVRRPGLFAPAVAALVLVAVTAHAMDDGHAVQVLRGVGILLACAWVATLDDPSGEVAGASPYPRALRSLFRITAGAFVVLPVWTVAAAVAEVRFAPTPTWGLTLEALALGVGGLGIGAGLRAWAGQMTPSHVALVGVVVLAVAADALPRGWVMVQGQIWGPPWEAAQVRWAALLLCCVGVLVLALRDPVRTPIRLRKLR